MKRFIIDVNTHWCGMDDSYRAVADEECDLYEIAESLAYENFESYGGPSLMAENQGYDPETMEGEDWDNLYEEEEESNYYDYSITEFTGTKKEWEEIGGEIYGEECESDCIGE